MTGWESIAGSIVSAAATPYVTPVYGAGVAGMAGSSGYGSLGGGLGAGLGIGISAPIMPASMYGHPVPISLDHATVAAELGRRINAELSKLWEEAGVVGDERRFILQCTRVDSMSEIGLGGEIARFSAAWHVRDHRGITRSLATRSGMMVHGPFLASMIAPMARGFVTEGLKLLPEAAKHFEDAEEATKPKAELNPAYFEMAPYVSTLAATIAKKKDEEIIARMKAEHDAAEYEKYRNGAMTRMWSDEISKSFKDSLAFSKFVEGPEVKGAPPKKGWRDKIPALAKKAKSK